MNVIKCACRNVTSWVVWLNHYGSFEHMEATWTSEAWAAFWVSPSWTHFEGNQPIVRAIVTILQTKAPYMQLRQLLFKRGWTIHPIQQNIAISPDGVLVNQTSAGFIPIQPSLPLNDVTHCLGLGENDLKLTILPFMHVPPFLKGAKALIEADVSG